MAGQRLAELGVRAGGMRRGGGLGLDRSVGECAGGFGDNVHLRWRRLGLSS